MSKSFNVAFAMSMRVTLAEETIQAIRTSLNEAAQLVEDHPEVASSKQRAAARHIRSVLQLEDEEFLVAFLKRAMRTGARQEIVKVFEQDRALGVSRMSPLDVKVTSRAPWPAWFPPRSVAAGSAGATDG